MAGIDVKHNNACTINFFRFSNAFSEELKSSCIVFFPRESSSCSFLLHSIYLKIKYGLRFNCLPNSINLLINIPRILRLIYLNKIDVVYIRANILSVFLTICLNFFSKTIIVTEHNGFFDEEFITLHKNKLMGRFFKSFQLLDARLSSLIRVVVPELKEYFVLNGVSESRIIIGGNVSDIQSCSAYDKKLTFQELNLNQGNIHIGFIGNLVCWQGMHIAIEALQIILHHIPNVRLIIAGTGVEFENLLQQSIRLQLEEKIIFLNEVSFEQIPKLLMSIDIAIAPYIKRINDTLSLAPLKLCDYALLAKPIIASDFVYSEDQKEWFLACEPNNPSDLAEKVIYFIKNPRMAEDLGQRARQYANVHFNVSKLVKKILFSIQEIIKSN